MYKSGHFQNEAPILPWWDSKYNFELPTNSFCKLTASLKADAGAAAAKRFVWEIIYSVSQPPKLQPCNPNAFLSIHGFFTRTLAAAFIASNAHSPGCPCLK